MNSIFAISPLDGRYSNKVLYLKEIVSEFGLNKYRVKVEVEWLKFLFTIKEFGFPSLDRDEITFLDQLILNFDEKACLRIKEIERTTNHDVKAIEYYLKEQLLSHPKFNQYLEYIHFACTSEDINNLSYALMLKELKHQLEEQEFKGILTKLLELSHKYKDNAMMSRTHGQPATPSTMGKELYNVYYRIYRQVNQLKSQEILGKINGAVGNYNAHKVSYPNINWPKECEKFITINLGLIFNPYTTQIEPHDYIAEFFDNLKRINTILIDLNRDIWGYVSLGYFKQKIISGEIGSSTMPHKVNPIDFENSEGNLGLSNALASFLAQKLPISRFQRDLTDSTVLRNIGVCVAYGVLGYKALLHGLAKLEINPVIISHDLEQNWELLAEPIQTVMRKCGIANPYEKLKELTRGKKVGAAEFRDFILSLDISQDEKNKLLALTPHNYIGFANKLF